MSDALSGFLLPRNEHPVRACVNLSSSVTIPANSVVELDSSNPPSSSQTGIAVALATTGATPYGVTIDDAPPGAQVRVQREGLIQVVAGNGAISAGAWVVPYSSGLVETTPTGVPALGIAVSAAGATNDQLMVELDITATS
jgi:hypothetical protein